MTSEEYVAFLRRHKERVEGDVEAKTALTGEMMTGLVQRVETAIVDLDLPISPDQARERLSTVRIQFFDPLSQVGQRVRSLGFYDHSIDTIYLNTSSTEEELLTILNHEGFHALEGRTPQVRSIVRAKFLGPEDEHASIRTGLSVDPRYGTQRFRWLDEAVTEDLNISVNDAKIVAYGLERDILGLLQQKVSSQVIRKAYFEDFEDGEAKVPGTPAWGEMQNQLAEAFEPGILLTLDKIIDAEDRKAYGLKKAAAYLREHFEQS